MEFLIFNDNCIIDSYLDKYTMAVDPSKIYAIEQCRCPHDGFPACYTRIHAQYDTIETFTDIYEILPHIPDVGKFIKLMESEYGLPVYVNPNAIVSMIKVKRQDGDFDTNIHFGNGWICVANSFQSLVEMVEEVRNEQNVDA